ncbi:hypothetical protein [Chitiniphilus shinanonensis]|uniref:hypothetical protein n=1 Tax=Chitiniphilus shinanonensis TaxID=553088 RepID=UPI00333F4521
MDFQTPQTIHGPSRKNAFAKPIEPGKSIYKDHMADGNVSRLVHAINTSLTNVDNTSDSKLK